MLEDGDQEELMLALRRMAAAFGGVPKLAEQAEFEALRRCVLQVELLRTGSMSESSKEPHREVCNSCGHRTLHRKLSEHRSEEILYFNELDEGSGFGDVATVWEILECLGCSALTLHEIEKISYEDEPTHTYFPERQARLHKRKSYEKLPSNLEALYVEVVTAFNRSLPLLCAGGLRALLEGLCEDRGIKDGPNNRGEITNNLEGRINGLSAIVPSGIVKNLHGLRFLGNRALHELDPPSKEDLQLALTVVEDILNVVYDLNYKSELLLKSADRRSRS